MTILKRLFVIASLLIIPFSFSQKTTSLQVTESKEIQDEIQALKILSFHTTTNGYTGTVRDGKNQLLFQIVDNNLNKIFSNTRDKERKEEMVGEVIYDNEIKLVTVSSPKRFERVMYCHVFNLVTQSYKREKILEVNVAKKQKLFGGYGKRQTNFAISEDGKHFAIATDNEKKHANSYTIWVFDANTMNLKYQRAYNESEDQFYEHNDLFIDNDMSVYSIGKQFIDGKRDKKKGKPNYRFVLNKITENKSTSIDIGLKDDFIHSLFMSKIGNDFNVFGFYSEESSYRVKGICSFSVNKKSLEVSNQKLHGLPLSIYEDIYGTERAEKKKNKELANFYIDYVLEDDLGNKFILAEQFYSMSYMTGGFNGMGGTYVTQFYYEDILVIKLNTSGDLEWGRTIHKSANSPSYNAFLKQGKLHVILNSGKKLSDRKGGRTMLSNKFLESTALYDLEFLANGNFSHNKIQDNKGKTFFNPYYGNYQNDSFIMMSDEESAAGKWIPFVSIRKLSKKYMVLE